VALLDNLKRIASVVNEMQNIELYQLIIDAQRQAFDLQTENAELKKKNEELLDIKELERKVVPSKGSTVIHLSDDEKKIDYCAICWGKDKMLIQMGHPLSLMAERVSHILECHACKNRCRV